MINQYAFAGYDVGGSFGTGFPFAYTFQTPVAPVNLSYPIGRFGKWWWRVKDWKLTSTAGTLADSSGSGATYAASPITIPYLGITTQELDLINPANFPNASVSYPGDNIKIVVTGLASLVTHNDLFYPDFQNVRLGIKTDPAGAEVLVINIDPSSPGPATGSMPGSIDGVPFTFYYHLAPIMGLSFSPGAFNIVPASFWSYGGIYNTSTGAVNSNQNPFSR